MRDHIHTLVGRYKGKIKVWDVVNEALADGGTNVLRNSLWLEIIGPDFIAKAFEYAHEADPEAILRYNDYSLEDPAKRRKLIALIKSLQAQQVPVMAIGSQAHVNVSTGFETMDQALTEIATLGLPIHITELDVNSTQGGQRSFGADIANNAATTQGGLVSDADRKLADAYAGLFRAFLKHDKEVKVVTFWGPNDANSWRANGKPLLFDGNNQPKPAFDAVIRVVTERMLSLLGYQPRTFISYFLPTPPHGELLRETWGATNVLPRDAQNGLEDTAMKKYCYWDGQIIKAHDGKYHMFASRWDESRGHGGWFGSVAVHAVSESLPGPYVDQGLCWPNDQGGKGHNVTALTLPDGRYAIVISETRPCEVYVSKSLDGPWERLGTITVEGEPRWHASNVAIMARPDGNFEFVPRDGRIFFSDKGILGPYQPQGNSVFPKGIPNLEDPCIWYSGGLYHIVVNSWSTRKAYHLTSRDGLHDWTNRGLAYDPREAIVRYPDGTVNHWNKAERPSVYVENGHVAAMTLAVIDVEKEQDKGNDGHGSKVIVIPFDGAALDRDLQSAAGSSKP